MVAPELLDAVGVPLAPGQRVVFAVAGVHATGQLVPGTVVKIAVVPKPDGSLAERISIQRDDHRNPSVIGWSKRILVLRQESEADGWLRRQLATLRPALPRGRQ